MPPTLYSSNTDTLRKKITTILSQGHSKLKLVTDFDATLSDPTGWSSWCVIEKRQELSNEFRQGIVDLVQTYSPYEISAVLTPLEKRQKMEEWREKAIGLLLWEDICDEMYLTIMKETDKYISFRPGADELLRSLHNKGIPALIFSAGISDVIDSLLYKLIPDIYTPCIKLHPNYSPEAHIEKMTPLIRIIANYIVLEEKERASTKNKVLQSGETSPSKFINGFDRTKPSINVFNKREDVIQHESYYMDQIAPRVNAIVMGDSLGDTTMVANEMNDEKIIRIGFLQEKIGKKTVHTHMESYLKVFDLVFVNSHDGIKWARDLVEAIPNDGDATDEIVNARVEELLARVDSHSGPY